MAVVVAVLAGVAAAGGQQMQPYTSTDGRFTVNFPQGEVKQSTDSIPYKDGTTGTMYEFTIELAGGNIAYMVMYNDYSAAQATGDPQAVLTNTRDGAIGTKTLLSDTAISLNGVPGREFTAKDDNWNYAVRQYLAGKRLYQLIVVSNNANPATQISDFMTSFKIF
ncbi:MAG: hypothetical protein WAL45_20405 [Terracidiphilus sp.]